MKGDGAKSHFGIHIADDFPFFFRSGPWTMGVWADGGGGLEEVNGKSEADQIGTSCLYLLAMLFAFI